MREKKPFRCIKADVIFRIESKALVSRVYREIKRLKGIDWGQTWILTANKLRL